VTYASTTKDFTASKFLSLISEQTFLQLKYLNMFQKVVHSVN